MNCTNDVGFSHYFNENMEALGLAFPGGPYLSSAVVVGAVKNMADTVDIYKNDRLAKVAFKATSGFASATIVSRVSQLILAVGGAFYVGAAIGSAAVATGRTLGCGTSLADVLAYANFHGLNKPFLEPTLKMHPRILGAIT